MRSYTTSLDLSYLFVNKNKMNIGSTPSSKGTGSGTTFVYKSCTKGLDNDIGPFWQAKIAAMLEAEAGTCPECWK